MRIDGVGKRFGAKTALRDVSFSLQAGERVALLGPNGAGKTTLLQILAGSMAPDEGEVDLPPAGWVPQRAAVYSKLTGKVCGCTVTVLTCDGPPKPGGPPSPWLWPQPASSAAMEMKTNAPPARRNAGVPSKLISASL